MPSARSDRRAVRQIFSRVEERRQITVSSLEDVTAILTSIAARAKEILGTDLAYLSLIDDSGTETSIRDGIKAILGVPRHRSIGELPRTSYSQRSSSGAAVLKS